MAVFEIESFTAQREQPINFLVVRSARIRHQFQQLLSILLTFCLRFVVLFNFGFGPRLTDEVSDPIG